MTDPFRKLAIAASFATLIAGGLSGCSSLMGSHVDCNVVKLQSESGRSDSEIAAAINATPSDVAACHGGETSGNKTSGTAVPAPY